LGGGIQILQQQPVAMHDGLQENTYVEIGNMLKNSLTHLRQNARQPNEFTGHISAAILAQ